MPERSRHSFAGASEDRYASWEDFRKLFDHEMNSLYQLAFLLTADHRCAEKCFIAGIEECAKQNHVFREWARVWAKRVIAENAIRELEPQPGASRSSASPNVLLHIPQLRGPGHFDANAVLGLEDFERFVFVLCSLEHYREHECALLLSCTAREVRDARNRAIAELASLTRVVSIDRKRVTGTLVEVPTV